jgi:hypothetical protein
MNPSKQTTQNTYYRIEVQGSLDAGWANWLNETVIYIEQKTGATMNTSFIVEVPDQAALRGLLGRLWNLNLTLISLQLLDADTIASLPEKPAAQENYGGAK